MTAAFSGWIENPPLLVVVSGPSGVGKTSICDRLVDEVADAVYSRSVTTRPMRPGETEGEEYHFVDTDAFAELERAGKLLESAQVHQHHYGTPRDFVDEQLRANKIIVLNIDVQGGLQVMDSYPDGVFVFVLPPSLETLRDRIDARGGDSPDAVEVRMRNAAGEIAEVRRYSYVVVNDELDACVARLEAILTAERCLRRRCYVPPEE